MVFLLKEVHSPAPWSVFSISIPHVQSPEKPRMAPHTKMGQLGDSVTATVNLVSWQHPALAGPQTGTEKSVLNEKQLGHVVYVFGV